MAGPDHRRATAHPRPDTPACTRRVGLAPPHARRLWPVLALAALAGGGCGFVPRNKIDECHRLSQTLRAENSRMKDSVLDLRAQNQDLSQRAVDDARKITAQEEAIDRLEKSVVAYQGERDKLAAAFEAIKRQVRLSAAAQPTVGQAGKPPLEGFAESHPGWTFDPKDGTLRAPADRLFEGGTPRLTAGARADLDRLAAVVRDATPDGQVLEVAGHGTAGGDVRKAGFDGETADDPDAADAGGTPAPGRFLAAARAAQVRAALVAAAGLDPARVRLTAPDGHDADGRITLRLAPRAGGLDGGAAKDK